MFPEDVRLSACFEPRATDTGGPPPLPPAGASPPFAGPGWDCMCVCVCVCVCVCLYVECVCLWVEFVGGPGWECMCVCVCMCVCLYVECVCLWVEFVGGPGWDCMCVCYTHTLHI